MRRFVLAITLACALSGTALGGEIHSTDVQSPAPAPVAESPGNIPTSDSTSPGDVPSVGVSILLTLLDLAF